MRLLLPSLYNYSLGKNDLCSHQKTHQLVDSPNN